MECSGKFHNNNNNNNNNNSLQLMHVTTNKNNFCFIFEMGLDGIKKSATCRWRLYYLALLILHFSIYS